MPEQQSRRSLLIPFILAVTVIVVDQITKALIVRFVDPIETHGQIIEVLGDFFRIIRTQNVGIALSIGQGLAAPLRRVLFIVLPLLVLAGLLVYYFRTSEFTRLQRWAIAGIVGGGLGNQLDRIFRPDGVVDWIDFKFYGIFGLQRFPTWNVADATITVCSILLLVSIFVQERKRATGTKEEANE